MRPRDAALLALLTLCATPSFARLRQKTLLKSFDAGDAEDRLRLAPALGRLRDRKATDALLLAFDVKRGDPRVTTAVVTALGEAGDPRAVDSLLGAWDYLKSVALQLGDLPPQLQILRERILEALSRIGGKRATALLEESLNSPDEGVAEAAVRGVGRLQDRKALPALQRMAGRGGDMTQAVFEALADIGDKRGASLLQDGLKSPDKFVQVEAAYALARLGREKEMVARLEGALKQDPGSEKVGVLAAYYLAKLDRASGLDHLVGLMNKPDSGWAAVAAESLGKSGNPRAALPLVLALKSGDSSVRLSAARSLGLLGGKRAVAALKRLRDDSNPGVRTAALASLMELGEAD